MQCKFNDAALEDIENITEYGYDHYGEDATRDYLQAMKNKCDLIAESPRQYQAVDDIRAGYRRGVYKAHAIYFRITDEAVEIMRILRSQNPQEQLQ